MNRTASKDLLFAPERRSGVPFMVLKPYLCMCVYEMHKIARVWKLIHTTVCGISWWGLPKRTVIRGEIDLLVLFSFASLRPCSRCFTGPLCHELRRWEVAHILWACLTSSVPPGDIRRVQRWFNYYSLSMCRRCSLQTLLLEHIDDGLRTGFYSAWTFHIPCSSDAIERKQLTVSMRMLPR